MIPFSVLDLSPILEGSDAALSFHNSLDLARHAEALGYHRYWLAEHHNMPGIASAATSVVIGHIAGGTKTIRVGSGGIMLPNHSPLVIAEQFGTLESLYSGRIDLGLGRAPGTDQRTAMALRRDLMQAAENFPRDVLELQALLGPLQPNQVIRAFPGVNTNVPIWLLGSSTYSAQLAGILGLPFAFAAHFAPTDLMDALQLYRARFQPSAQLDKPYAMVCIGIFAADTDQEAQRLFTSQMQQHANLRRGKPTALQPPVDHIEDVLTPPEIINAKRSFVYAQVGTPETILPRLQEFLNATMPDELMVAGQIYDQAARKHSYELVMSLRDRLTVPKAPAPERAGQPA